MRRMARSETTPITESCGPGHAGVGDERGALREHARVGGLDVRVRPDDGRDAAVEPAREGDLLARRLGVRVHEHERRLAAGRLHELVDHLEHRACGVQEQRPEDVDDRETSAVRRRHDREPPAGRVHRGVRRPDDLLRLLEVGADLRPAEGVVPERDRVGAGREQAVGEAWRDPDPVGGVLAVQHAGVDLELGLERLEPLLDRPASRRADDVRDEEDAQEVRSARLPRRSGEGQR